MLKTQYRRKNMFQFYLLLSLFVINYVESNFTSDCGKKEKIASYLDIAVEMINKAKSGMSQVSDLEKNVTMIPVDCADILRMGHNKSGVYTIRLMNRVLKEDRHNVYCDMDTDGGGWTVIQRRGNYGNPEDYFFREWKSYKEGFGNIEKEFWLGNDNIFALTNQKQYSVRIDLQDVKFNKSHALYDSFWIDDEFNNYTLHAKDFSGDAGDSLKVHNEYKFSTKDVHDDRTNSSYGKTHKSGWWNGSTFLSNLNGLYTIGGNSITCMYWFEWRSLKCLFSAEIKIRPNNFVVSKDFTNTPQ